MPSLNSLHVQAIDPMLTMYAEGIAADIAAEYNFLTSGIPIMQTKMKSNKYRTFPRSPFSRGAALARLPHQMSAEVTFEWSTDTYSTETYAVSTMLSEDEINDSDNPELLRTLHTDLVVHDLLLKHEISFAAKFFVTGKWGTDVVGGVDFVKWSDGANSDPVADVLGWQRTLDINGGFPGNTLIVGPDVDRALRTHPAVINRMSLTGLRIPTSAILAQLFGVEKYIVAGAKQTTSTDGTAEASSTYDYVFGKSALLAYMGKSGNGPGASAARIFVWSGSGAASPSAGMGSVPVKVIPRLETKDYKIEAEMNWDHKITASKLGLFASLVVA